MKTGLSSSRPRKPSQSPCPSYLHQEVLSLLALQNFTALATMPGIRGRELVYSDVGEMEITSPHSHPRNSKSETHQHIFTKTHLFTPR